MAGQSSFKTDRSDRGMIFDVNPAAASLSAYFIPLSVCAFGLFVSVSLVALRTIGTLIFVVGVAVLARSYQRYRRAPVRLVVSAADGISVPGTKYAADDIRKLYIAQPWTNGGESTSERLSDSTAAIGQMVRWGAEERSYALMLRTRSTSELKVLARGLTYRNGQMLLEDVREALGGKS